MAPSITTKPMPSSEGAVSATKTMSSFEGGASAPRINNQISSRWACRPRRCLCLRGVLEERPAGARPSKHICPIVGSIDLGFNR
jgi:hypothetical protein